MIYISGLKRCLLCSTMNRSPSSQLSGGHGLTGRRKKDYRRFDTVSLPSAAIWNVPESRSGILRELSFWIEAKLPSSRLGSERILRRGQQRTSYAGNAEVELGRSHTPSTLYRRAWQ